jgi:hypothetical protein
MVELPLSELVDAGTILMRAARWEDADRLLTTADTEHPAERAIIAIRRRGSSRPGFRPGP